MLDSCVANAWKREHPRVSAESLCTELDDHQLRHALVVDLSETGLRIQRPIGGRIPRDLQLEFEIPEVDEIVWARGRVVFDEVWKVPRTLVGSMNGMVRTIGIELVASAERHRRMLREYVTETWRQMTEAAAGATDHWMYRAVCQAHGIQTAYPSRKAGVLTP
jgi:hypothetical protein